MLRIKTTRRQPLSARSVWIEAPHILAALSSTGHPPKKGSAELDRASACEPGATGALDLEEIITLLIKEAAQCRAELNALKSRQP